ncbi:CCA tRNA nucleotidyltransferase [Leucobacter sp. UCMA 4100]|uniref:CCA tRNA nucleotidyltransferase n=1 Tax=Leucobacter sp. UCMA 4100 TaxID=2810534 RepID=UPI0022EB5199|nr:CCA tRNA nucleotidyltransferase [Leucobacter sp. UCMA 4100]MDA3147041.1 CCA tRNA nucleotidyltransferase [Leucobacter sp. UCMA 4100]
MLSLAESMATLTEIAESKPVKALAEAFAAAGHECALVGGPVRDALIGRPVTDLDFATSARPDETREILETIAQKTWDVGRAFGTIAARVHGEQVEVTTYRSDVYREDSRKPVVAFGDTIEGDLVRRDFTINALALMLPEMRLVDVSGGVEDLIAGTIMTPGSAEQSFSDDPLRMMRAARFASQLGFAVDPRVTKAMTDMADRLDIISAERVRDELVKTLSTDDPVAGLRILVDTGLCDRFLPEFSALREMQDDHGRHKDVYEHTLTVLEQAIALEKSRGSSPDGPDVTLRLAAVMHDIGKPATRRYEQGQVTFRHHDVVGAKLTKKRLRELRFDNETIAQVAKLVELHLRFFGYSDQAWSDSAVRRYVRDAGSELERLHIITRADVTTRNKRKADRLEFAYDDIERRIDELAEQEALDAVRPELDGQQIMQLLGIAPGREVGLAYKFLLDLRLDEGPIGEAAAAERLIAWWAEQQSGDAQSTETEGEAS